MSYNVPMTLAIPRQIITPEQLDQMPDHNGMELVNGQVIEKNVSFLSSGVELRIGTILSDALKDCQVLPASMGYRCFPADENRVRKPDVSVVLHSRFASLGVDDVSYMPIVPDLAVEVTSKNDSPYEIEDKIAEYQEAGFPLVWQVNPKARSVAIYSLNVKPVVLFGDDEITLPTIDANFRRKISEFFPATLSDKK